MEIYIGQMLKNQSGEKAIVKKVLFEFVFIEYHNSIKRIRKSLIGNEWTIDSGEICSRHDAYSSGPATVNYKPTNPKPPIYDQDGYDAEGYNKNGFNRSGYNRQGFDVSGYDRDGYNKEGYNRKGFNRNGIHHLTHTKFDEKGFDQKGYDADGYNRRGYDINGFNRQGFNRKGFDREGFNVAGYDQEGYNRQGYDKNGLDRNGYDQDGFDKYGYDQDGYYRDGYNISGYDRDGYNRAGFSKAGYNREGFDRFGYDRDGYDYMGYDQHGFDRAGMHRSTKSAFDDRGFTKEGFDKDGFDRNGYNSQGFDRRGFNREGYNVQGYNSSGFNIAGLDQEGYNRQGFDKDGYDREGYDREGFDKSGYDRKGYDRTGYNRQGVDVDGFDREGYNSEGLHKDGYYKNDSLEKKEPIQERKYFDRTLVAAMENLQRTTENLRCHSDKRPLRFYESNADEFDPYEFQKEIYYFQQEEKQLNQELRMRTESCEQPYFARVDYRQHQGLYIGKHGIEGFVTDWADRACAVYYNYTIYIGNPEHDLTLVRDFDIHDGKYNGYTDKYRKGLTVGKDLQQTVDTIADDRLAQVINTYKASKKVHDIIATIQANQYQIITQNKAAFLSVCGCAGSGKTMIMFHRLRYLLYNNRDIDINQTFLISPINLLLQASDELSQTLQVQNANHLTTNQFYKYAITSYAKGQGLPTSQPGLVSSNYKLCSETIKLLYDCDSCNNFQESITVLFDTTQQCIFGTFVALEVETLHKKLSDFGCKTENTLEKLLIKKDLYQKGYDIYIKAKKVLFEYSKENARVTLERLKPFGAQDNVPTNDGLFKLNNLLQYLIDNNKFLGKTKTYQANKTSPTEILPIDTTKMEPLCLLFGISIEKEDKKTSRRSTTVPFPFCIGGRIRIEYSHGEKYQDPLELFTAYEKLHNKVKRLQKFAKSRDKGYLLDIIESKIANIKQKYSVPLNETYEWELFYTCLGFYAAYGQVDDETRYIFLDEFQDCAPVELDCMRRMFPKAVFDLFGDPKQCITPKGIQNAQDIPFQTAQYKLNENYRNALEITEYVNQKFDMQMLPVGLHGGVRKADQVSVTRDELESGDRIAVIYKEKASLACYDITEENSIFSFLDAPESDLIPQKINVLPIFQAKGLEFEKVFVICEKMSKNEKYVAMTRALNELIILETKLDKG